MERFERILDKLTFFDNIQNIFPLCNIFMKWLIQYLIIANMTIVQ